ncbi:MAG: polysaccharide deacetylase family protein, partial [bacterium]
KREIETHLKKPCDLFSYPNGSERDFAKRDQATLQSLGYRAAFSQISGFNALGDNLYAIKRINIARSNNFSFFLAKITGVQPMIKKLV